MPDVAAPYQTGTDLTQMKGDALLSGVAQNFNPENQNPLAPLQNTISQLGAEQNQDILQKKQQIFQQQQQNRQFQQDIFAKAMDQDYADKVMQYKQNITDRDNLYKRGALSGFSAFNTKDKDGNDLSFAPLPDDQKLLGDNADLLTKEAVKRGYSTVTNDSDYQNRLRNQETMKNIASTRAVEVAKLKNALANASPADHQHIQDQLDAITQTPLNTMQFPDSYLPPPEMKPILDPTAKDFPKRDDWDTYTDKDGNDMDSVPVAYHKAILYATQPSVVKQIHTNAKYIRALPEATDPASFSQWDKQVQDNLKAKGEPPIDLGQLVNDGNGGVKVVLNPDDRVIDFASELIHTGGLVQSDPDKAMKQKLTEAEIDEKNAQAYKARHPEPKARNAAEIKEDIDLKAAQSAKAEASKVFDYKNNPEYKPVTGEDSNKPFFALMKNKGYNPDDYTFYQVPKNIDAKRGVGVRADVTTVGSNASGAKADSAKGQSVKPDVSYLAVNKNGDKEIINLKRTASGGASVISAVPEREYASNILKHDAQYDQKVYENKVVYAQNLYDQELGRQAAPAQQQSAPVQQKVIGGVTYEKDANGKWYKAQ